MNTERCLSAKVGGACPFDRERRVCACWRPRMGLAGLAREITWEDLIPPGVPYAEIIGEGEMDEAADTWRPIYDANGANMRM